MLWTSALSNAATLDQALTDVIDSLQKALSSQKPDVCFVFVSSAFRQDYPSIPQRLQQALGARVLIGCSGGGVIGNGQEMEHTPAISVTAAVLPDVTVTPFRIADSLIPDLDASPRAWHQYLGIAPQDNPQFILLADPFSLHIENVLMGLDYAYPKASKVGGLASGTTQPGENALFFNGICYKSGAVGVAFSGNIALDTLVAQGCRPIGKPYCITKCDRNILLELDGQRPLELLRDIFQTLNAQDQNLMHRALFLGLVMDPLKSHFTQGDFLIRNIVGLDPEKGILAVGNLLRAGQQVQFHLRDASTSADDLDHVLTGYQSHVGRPALAGGLIFSCLGRGQHLYGHPHHDSHAFINKLGSIPLSGFFCNGEIGPVAGTTYLHGYTSCFALFRPIYVPMKSQLLFERAKGKLSTW